MAKTTSLLERYARMGALSRLNELNAEVAEIERAFPGIGGDSSGRQPKPSSAASGTKTAKTRQRKRKPMTAAQKKAVGDRMRKVLGGTTEGDIRLIAEFT